MRLHRRGNVTMVVMLMGTLLGFSALSIDIGLIRVAGTETQVTLDAAALSATQVLDGTDAGINKSVAVAIDVAGRNNVLGRSVVLTQANVDIGTYNPVDYTFVSYSPGDNPAPVNAVRIDHVPPAFDVGLGGVAFGAVSYSVSAKAMGVRKTNAGPAGSTDCFLPLAIPDCHLAAIPPGLNPPPMKFTFNPSPTDSVAWANPSANPNSNWLRSQVQNGCASGQVSVGDPAFVNEGVHNSVLQEVASMLNGGSTTTWDPMYGALPPRDGTVANLPGNSAVLGPRYGATLEGAVMLVNGGIDCTAVSFAGSLPVTGIGWGVIYDVMDSGGNKNLWIQLDVVGQHSVNGEVDPTATGLNVLGTGGPTLGIW